MKKRFFVTLGMSIFIWLVTCVLEVYGSFARNVATFTTGCQTTGYPINLCHFEMFRPVPIVLIVFNIIFWFFMVELLRKLIEKRKAS